MAEQNQNETKKEVSEAKKKPFSIPLPFILVGICFLIIGIGLYALLTQPSAVTPQHLYEFIKNNFNTTIQQNFILPTSLIQVTNSTIRTYSNITKNYTTFTFPSDNKTYIYFFGFDGCSQCAVESYVIWNYTTHKPFPAYDSNFYLAQFSLPGIPQQYLITNVSSKYILVGAQAPVTAQMVNSQSTNQSELDLTRWLIKNLDFEQKYVFTSSGLFPTVIVAKTTNNQTMLCDAFSGISLVFYNSTNANQFVGINMKNQTLGNSLLPMPKSISQSYNQLNACVKIVDNFKG